VVAGRDTASALELWRRLPAAQRERIESVAIDMSPEFTAAAR
jgi:transposase